MGGKLLEPLQGQRYLDEFHFLRSPSTFTAKMGAGSSQLLGCMSQAPGPNQLQPSPPKQPQHALRCAQPVPDPTTLPRQPGMAHPSPHSSIWPFKAIRHTPSTQRTHHPYKVTTSRPGEVTVPCNS